jgi:mRNA interferase RelE/StbE
MYEIKVASSRIEKELAKILSQDRRKVIEGVRKLAEDPRPRGIKSLGPDVYRLRVGKYRVIYKVFEKDKLVLIGKFARRSEKTYRGLKELFR